MHSSEICFLYRVLPFAVLVGAKPLLFFSNLKGTKHAGALFVVALRNQQWDLVALPLQIGSEVSTKCLGYVYQS